MYWFYNDMIIFFFCECECVHNFGRKFNLLIITHYEWFFCRKLDVVGVFSQFSILSSSIEKNGNLWSTNFQQNQLKCFVSLKSNIVETEFKICISEHDKIYKIFWPLQYYYIAYKH